MHARDAWEAEADAAQHAARDAERVAELEAEDAAFRAVVRRRTELEMEVAAELRRVVEERGRGPETTHDVALAVANVGYRLGYTRSITPKSRPR